MGHACEQLTIQGAAFTHALSSSLLLFSSLSHALRSLSASVVLIDIASGALPNLCVSEKGETDAAGKRAQFSVSFRPIARAPLLVARASFQASLSSRFCLHLCCKRLSFLSLQLRFFSPCRTVASRGWERRSPRSMLPSSLPWTSGAALLSSGVFSLPSLILF